MADYRLPRNEKDEMVGMPESKVSAPSDYQRRVRVPANQEILDALGVGDEITVTLTGKVVVKTDRSSSDDYDEGERSVELEIFTVSVPEDGYTDDEDTALFNKGFMKGPTRLGS